MPFKSKSQQRWMFSQHPQMAKLWAKHTPKISALPEKVGVEPAVAKHHQGKNPMPPMHPHAHLS